MVMDGAAWHKSNDLKSFDNISSIFQPPYSPEVNPVEHLWEHLREKYLRNKSWTSMDELEITLSEALLEITINQKEIQKLVGFHWAIV